MTVRGVAESATVLWRTFGWRGLVQRAGFEARRQANAFRAAPLPVGVVSRASMPDEWPFRPNAQRVRETTERDIALQRAARVLAGQHEAYRWTWRPRPTADVEWLIHPDSGFRYAGGDPWWRVAHFDRRAGDIKDVWEPARFAWAYELARGWLVTGDDTFVGALLAGVSTFLRSSPPFRGPHWACGQETAIRAVAWLWAEGACHGAPSFDQAAAVSCSKRSHGPASASPTHSDMRSPSAITTACPKPPGSLRSAHAFAAPTRARRDGSSRVIAR